MVERIGTFISGHLAKETLQPFGRYAEIELVHEFLDERWRQLMRTVKDKFNAVTGAYIENFRNVKAVFEVNQPAFQLLIADYQIAQIFQIHILVGECYDFEILQGCSMLT